MMKTRKHHDENAIQFRVFVIVLLRLRHRTFIFVVSRFRHRTFVIVLSPSGTHAQNNINKTKQMDDFIHKQTLNSVKT